MIAVLELLFVNVHVFVRTILIALIAIPLLLAFPSTLLFEIGDLPILVDVEDLIEPYRSSW